MSPSQVRFVLREPWPDCMLFYGTTASGAGWIVPKKYVEKVGDDGFKRAPIGAGPYRVVAFTPGVHVPIYELAFIWGVGPRVEVSGANLIPGFAYSAPFEDLKLKP